MKTINKIFVPFCVILFAAIIISGCGKSEEHDTMEMEEAESQIDSSIIRDFRVDVASLDENEDGEIYQCPMHPQVISDEAGECPLCMMNLREYSVSEAQKNLVENKPNDH